MYGIIVLIIVWLLVLPVSAEPGLLLTSEPGATVRVHNQTAVVGYQNGREILQLDVELEVSQPTNLLRILPFPSNPEVSSPEERTSETIAEMAREGKFGAYSEQTAIRLDSFDPSLSESVEPDSEVSLRISTLEPLEELSRVRLNRPLSSSERMRLQRYLDLGYRNFYLDSCSIDGRVALPVRTFRFSSGSLYYPLSVHGRSDHLQLLVLTAWGRFHLGLWQSFIQQLSEHYPAEEVLTVDRLRSRIRRRDLFAFDEELYSMFPHSLSGNLILASGPTSPTGDLLVSGEGQRTSFVDMEGVGASYLPLGEGNWWKYQVKSGSVEFERTLNVSSHERDTVGTVRVFLHEKTPNSSHELVYTFHDGAASYDGRYPAGSRTQIHFKPQVPLYVMDGHFDYPATGQSGGPVPGAERVYEGRAWSDDVNKSVGYGETFRAVSLEEVTVPAGTFRALRTEIFAEGVSPAATHRVEWYADGVGLVKAVEGFGDSRVVSELTSYQVSH